MIENYPFGRILIPYDGSPTAHKALEWAAHLAKAGGPVVEKVTLLRVIGGAYLARHIQNVDLRVTRMDQIDAWQRVRKHYLDHDILPSLDEARKYLQEQQFTATVETKVAEGKVGEEIIRVAHEGGYDTIVMGRRGLSPVKSLFLGSVTRQVLSLLQSMTIFIAGQEVAIKPVCPISPVLLPVDGSETSLKAVRQGAALARKFRECQPQLTLLHVIDVAKFGASLNTGTSFWAEEGEEILSSGRRILNEAGLDGLYTDKLLMGHPSRIIAAEADEGQYPLILLGARGLSPLKQLILGSVSSDVVHQVSKAIVGIVYP